MLARPDEGSAGISIPQVRRCLRWALTESLSAATMPGSMPTVRRVSLLGLPHPEREAITTCLLAARGGNRRYVLAEMLDEADLFIADAGHDPSVQLVVAIERLAATVFVGSSSPPGSVACLSRPIDTAHQIGRAHV